MTEEEELELLELENENAAAAANTQKPEAPAEPSLMEAAFPGAHKERPAREVPMPFTFDPKTGRPLTRTMGSKEQQATAAVGDAFTLTTRAAGAVAGEMGYEGATGGKKPFKEALADPETGLSRPLREKLGGVVAERMKAASDEERSYIKRVGDALIAELAAAGYLVASAVEDPAALAGGAAKVLPKVADDVAQAVAAPIAGAGRVVDAGAKSTQKSILKPRAMDEAGGFHIDNVFKHGVEGSVDEVVTKSQDKITEASKTLRQLITEGKDKGARVDLLKAIREVEKDIEASKAKHTPILKEYKAALKDLKERAQIVAKDGKADLLDAQFFKQGMGDIGAWEHVANGKGVTIPRDESVKAQLASMVYVKLKAAIEEAGPAGIKEQNRILSELIPVHRAAAYRKVVADRQNLVSMSDFLGALATISGGPQGAAIWALSKGSMKGGTVKTMASLARNLKKAKSPKDRLMYAKALQRYGATAGEIDALAGVPGLMSSLQLDAVGPFRQVAESDATGTDRRRAGAEP